ncbi:DUF4219 domain-containing protein [Cephalotus follicularis]|uniref:DUF4219 domain-containing protein n=1 Tax=Cephalotus follicularis TaxID=3775 RepID=A0A1Q3AYN9_CEPFO|nr:DUF4219 domain-containing protein [Cephalotus follicularis]
MAPFFDGNNFNKWKNKMTSFIQSLDYDLWDVIVIGPKLPRYDERELLKFNAKVKHVIFCSLSSNVFESISLCSSPKELWHKLEHFYGENNDETTSLCLMAKDASKSESDEEDSSKGGNEVSYDDFVEVVDRYTSINSSLKTKIKSLTIENNELKSNASLMNDNVSKDEIVLLKNEVNRLSKENETLKK